MVERGRSSRRSKSPPESGCRIGRSHGLAASEIANVIFSRAVEEADLGKSPPFDMSETVQQGPEGKKLDEGHEKLGKSLEDESSSDRRAGTRMLNRMSRK